MKNQQAISVTTMVFTATSFMLAYIKKFRNLSELVSLYLSPFEGSSILDQSPNTPDKTSQVTWPRGSQLNLGGKR
jgi:hypothetical protein